MLIDFYINDDENLEEKVNELNRILKKAGATAWINKSVLDTRIVIAETNKNVRNAGKKEIDVFMTVEQVLDMIKECGAEKTAECVGMTKQGMYKRLKKRKTEGRKWF